MMYRRTDPLLDWWKSKAEYKQERINRLLSRDPVTPRQTWRRKVLVQQALRSVDNRKTWTDAYDQYLGGLREVLMRWAPPNSTLSDTSGKGDLEE